MARLSVSQIPVARLDVEEVPDGPISRYGRGRRDSRGPGRMPRYFSSIRSAGVSDSSRPKPQSTAGLAGGASRRTPRRGGRRGP